jgi:hypothetical protein
MGVGGQRHDPAALLQGKRPLPQDRPGRVCRIDNLLPPPEFEPPTVKSVASRCAVYSAFVFAWPRNKTHVPLRIPGAVVFINLEVHVKGWLNGLQFLNQCTNVTVGSQATSTVGSRYLHDSGRSLGNALPELSCFIQYST